MIASGFATPVTRPGFALRVCVVYVGCMDREEALAILRCGGEGTIQEWNRRRAKGEEIPDLSGADLEGTDLRGADLSGTELCSAILADAKLSDANFSGANLRIAHLNRADLSGADLSSADFGRAELLDANLSGAILNKANLVGVTFVAYDGRSTTNLSGADLTGTRFTAEGEGTVRGSFLDLAAVEGLESLEFDTPDFLRDYIERAFAYAHDPVHGEHKVYPDFVGKAIANIKALRGLYAGQEPPQELIVAIQAISAELIKYLAKHPKELYNLRPRQFEELVAEVLASYGWEVNLTPAIKDGGYDIFGIHTDQAGVANAWIIECKKYGPENKVGVDIARALYGTKALLRPDCSAMLATTSHFTKGVKEFKASRYDLDLREYEDILRWINEHRPHPGGDIYVKDNKLFLPGDE